MPKNTSCYISTLYSQKVTKVTLFEMFFVVTFFFYFAYQLQKEIVVAFALIHPLKKPQSKKSNTEFFAIKQIPHSFLPITSKLTLLDNFILRSRIAIKEFIRLLILR